MKLMHLSDLHLGKRLNEFSLINDQKYILNQILSIADKHHPDCVIIAGDVYDKSNPSAEAVSLFDYFLSELHLRKLPVMIISGNHDSAERIAFGAQVMKSSNIYLSPVYHDSVEPVVLKDESGEIRFYLLPHIRSREVAGAIEAMKIDTRYRNVLIAHQYITGAERAGSESFYVGSLENIEASVFSDFDYVALGHLHRPQNVTEKIYYCGTPLKYSLDEAEQEKSVAFVEIGEKNTPLHITTVPLNPELDLRKLNDSFYHIQNMESSNDYLYIILTDKERIPDALNRLRVKFPNIMDLKYENLSEKMETNLSEIAEAKLYSPMELFSGFFKEIHGEEMSEEEKILVEQLITEIWEGESS